MRPQIRIISACLLWVSILGAPTWSFGVSSTFTEPCDTHPHDFPGPHSGIFDCFVDGNHLVSSSAQGNATAGENFFVNSISPIRIDKQDLHLDTLYTFTYEVTSHPTWGKDIDKVPTFLRLDGVVSILEHDSALIITLTGKLGGPELKIGPLSYFGNSGCPCPLGFSAFGYQDWDTTATETLEIKAIGRVRYEASSPEFQGAVPEPSSLLLLATGLAGLIGVARQYRRRQPGVWKERGRKERGQIYFLHSTRQLPREGDTL